MCQMNVMLEREGRQEKLLENVTFLEVTPEGLRISTLFEEPQLVQATLKSIDFLAGKVSLEAGEKEDTHG